MKVPGPAKRSVVYAAICCAGMLMIGCSVFVGRVVLTPGDSASERRRPFDDTVKATATEIGREVAARNGLELVPEPYSRLGGEDYSTVSIYQSSGKIWLSLLVKDDGTEMAYVFTDQRHGEETKVTAALRRDLIREVGERLPGTVVKFEHRTEKGSLMGP